MVYLEEYMEAMEKIHGKHAKEYERALKVQLDFGGLGAMS